MPALALAIPPRPAYEAAALADHAVVALVEEARLTPKPGLVDRRGSGAHDDLDLALMIRSAHALRPGFRAMAEAAADAVPGRDLRERLAALGRAAETAMMAATGGVNTHRGAIWCLGLLVAAAAIVGSDGDARFIAGVAGAIARNPDRFAPPATGNGARASRRHGVPGARGEAMAGFPHVVELGLPALRSARAAGRDEDKARLDALMAIMASLDDTCLLHRGGREALDLAQAGAAEVLAEGGTGEVRGLARLFQLETELLRFNASPGGCADLLAAVLFLDRLDTVVREGDPAPTFWR
jgi:triphosphoribosyl-dephospho-CoA synthase